MGTPLKLYLVSSSRCRFRKLGDAKSGEVDVMVRIGMDVAVAILVELDSNPENFQMLPMNNDFSCCSLDGVQKGVERKVCPKSRYHKTACSMVYSKSLLTKVYSTLFIRSGRIRGYIILGFV